MAATNGTVESDFLFSPDLISPTVASALPEGYTVRPLQRADFGLGFLDVLRVLTHVGEVTQQEFEERFDQMKAGAGGYHVLVILDGDAKIVGTGALIVERKLYVHLKREAYPRSYANRTDWPVMQYPSPRPCRSHRGHRCREGSARQEARIADYSGLGLRGGEDWMLQDDSGLLRGQRGVLRQVWIQEGWIGDGTLLRAGIEGTRSRRG